jgi:hypothetical protein
VGGIVIDRVNKIFGDKLVPLPFLQHLMPWGWTQASEMRSRQPNTSPRWMSTLCNA